MEWNEYVIKFFDKDNKVVDVETVYCKNIEDAKHEAKWLTERSDKFVEYTKVRRIYKHQK